MITPATPVTIPAQPAIPAITTTAVWIHNLTVTASDPNRPVKITGYTSQIGTHPITGKLVSAPGTSQKINVLDLFSAATTLTTAQSTALATATAGLTQGQLLTVAYETICQAVGSLLAPSTPATPAPSTPAPATSVAAPVKTATKTKAEIMSAARKAYLESKRPR
jgi:hypothetical protein